MGKRFCDTSIWDDPWFLRMSNEHRLLWWYLFSKCDQAGVIDIYWEGVSTVLRKQVTESDLAAFAHRIIKLQSGKFLIVDFVRFQNKKLSTTCHAHIPIFESLDKHGLTLDPDTRKAKPVK